MATPTSAIDDLRGLLSPDEQVLLNMLLKNEKAKGALDEGLTMRKEYLGEPVEGDDAARAAAVKAAADKAEADLPTSGVGVISAPSRASSPNSTPPSRPNSTTSQRTP
jgi:hypothetical protein